MYIMASRLKYENGSVYYTEKLKYRSLIDQPHRGMVNFIFTRKQGYFDFLWKVDVKQTKKESGKRD